MKEKGPHGKEFWKKHPKMIPDKVKVARKK
jgi:hypothetical protein